MITVNDVKATDQARAWDEFVLACPESTFFHLLGWKTVIETSYRHRCHYLFAEEDGKIIGVLPLVHINSALFGNALISNAFCVRGGPIAVSDPARAALDRKAIQLAEQLRVGHLEYRLSKPMHDDWSSNPSLYANFAKPLDPDPERNMLAIPRKQRAMVRKGIKGGLVSEIDEDINRFFGLYAESLRNLGTPVHSKRFFANLKAVFGDRCEITTILNGTTAVSSVMSFYFRNEVLPYYGGGSEAARAVAAFDFMYWEVMRRACERGILIFDYGRSKLGTGSFAFKKHWGFEPHPLHYEYKLIRRAEMPNVNPLNPKYQTFIGLWKRLPIALANSVGPYLARQLG